MKYLKKLFVLVLSLFCFNSCAKNPTDLNVQISPKDKNIFELSTKVYDTEQLNNIVEQNRSICELERSYPLDCIKTYENGYRISFLGEFEVAELIFDSDGQNGVGGIFKLSCSKSDFDKIHIGQTLEDVQAIDPDGQYLFLLAGRNDFPRYSVHFTEDGYRVMIFYDNNNVITEIKHELI